jgi:gas vesicle protein
MKKQNNGVVGKLVALGASVAALGAATYYFFGPEGKKHQKNFKGWMIKMKADIVEKIEDAGEVTETVYHKIIDEVSAAYAKTGKVSKEEIALYADVLKKQWSNVVKSTKKPVKRAVKTVKAPIERAVKKIAKKVAKKK